MRNEQEQEKKPHFMRYTVKFKIWADKNEDRTETFIVSEFIEKSPIVARQKTIEQYKKIHKILEALELLGMLGYTNTILDDGISRGGFWGEISYKDVYNMSDESELTDDSGFDIVDNLIEEYTYYVEQGFDTGETEDIKDNRGNDCKIMPFRLK